MQTLGEIKRLLASHGLRPKRRFGQNFLHDAAAMNRVVDAAGVEAGGRVLEVGPGTGSLTQRLLEAGARVTAVEVDRDLATILREQLGAGGRDGGGRAGEADRGRCAGGQARGRAPGVGGDGKRGAEGFSLVANLPYNVASPLLLNMAVQAPGMSRAVVMVQQREVADRIVAEPGGKAYGAMGVVLQAQFACSAAVHAPAGRVLAPAQGGLGGGEAGSADPAAQPRPARAVGVGLAAVWSASQAAGTILGRDTPLPPGLHPTMRPEQASVEQLCQLAKITSVIADDAG